MHSQVSLDLVNCNLCGHPHSTPYYNDGEWYIVSCDNCNHTFTNPRPTPESLPSFYTETYFKDERHRDKFYNEDGTPKVVSDKYTNRIIDVENYCNARGRVLEIGAARGAFLKVLRERGWQVDGVEISADAVKLAKEHNNIDLFCGILEEYTTNENFDVVCMYQTLEHVLQPDFICKRSYELLKNEGKLVIEVPNRNCFEMKWSKKRRKLSYDLPRHISHFSPQVLAIYLKGLGFKEVHVLNFPDRLILSLFNSLSAFKSKFARKPTTQNSTNSLVNTIATNQLPMLRYPNSRMAKLINKISEFIPGWRFTIIAIK